MSFSHVSSKVRFILVVHVRAVRATVRLQAVVSIHMSLKTGGVGKGFWTDIALEAFHGIIHMISLYVIFHLVFVSKHLVAKRTRNCQGLVHILNMFRHATFLDFYATFIAHNHVIHITVIPMDDLMSTKSLRSFKFLTTFWTQMRNIAFLVML